MPGKHYDLDNDVLLGGINADDITIPSQKAVKSYIDKQIEDVTAGATTKLEALTDVSVENAQNNDVLAYNGTTWANTKLDIPSKTSELENDSNFLTEVPSEYITETELTQKNYITLNDIQSTLDSKANDADLKTVAKTGSYNDLVDLPQIPGEYDLPTASTTVLGGVKIDGNTITINNDVISAKQVDISHLAVKTEVDSALELKANKTEIPTKVSQLENDENYLKEIPAEYITETELETNLTAKAYLTIAAAQLNYALKEEIPTKVSQLENDSKYITETELGQKGFITSTELSDKGFITEIPQEYVTETELEAKGYLTEHQSLEEYIKTETVNNLLAAKADKSELTAMNETHTEELNKKANKTDVETALNSKADKTTTENELALKATKEELTTGLNTKADKTELESLAKTEYVNTELNKKANSNDVYVKTETYNKTEIDAKVASVFRYSGSVKTYDALPTGAVIGDCYNVEADGANYAWNGTEWDKLSETIDLTPYLTKTEAETIYAKITDLKDVATTGSYNDLQDTPEIPVVKETYDASSTDAMSGSAVAEAIANKVVTFIEY